MSPYGRAAAPLAVTSALTALVAGGLCALFLIDAEGARHDPRTYEAVHHMAVADYIVRNWLYAGLLACAATPGLLHFFDRPRARSWGVLSGLVLVSLAVAYAIGYYRWAAGGFDH
jgi:hypothetical protein